MKAGALRPIKTGAARAAGASIAEFGPVLVLFVLITIIPLANLLFFLAGYTTVSAISQGCVTDAANSATFTEALANVQKRTKAALESSLGKFVKLQAVGGYKNCGVDVYIATTNVANPNIGQFFGPNTGLPAGTNADSATTIYQYNIRSSFNVGPCINLTGLPLLGDLPMVGKPSTVEISKSRTAEHIDCLSPSQK
jgi:hypothetical protein